MGVDGASTLAATAGQLAGRCEFRYTFTVVLSAAFFPDACHMEWDNARNACTDAGFQKLMKCYLMAVSFPPSPYLGSAFGQAFHDMASAYICNSDDRCEYFSYWYEKLSYASPFSMAQFGTDEHRRRVYTWFCIPNPWKTH